MIAVIEKANDDHIARFERHFMHSVEDVWSWLTENKKLTKWFSELSVEDLREGGMIKFDMQDGTFEEMAIIELKTNSILEYTWGEDSVRFELYQEPEGCRLVFIEKIKVITPHTPKDLAGWHVCLDVINALIDGKKIDSRQDEWKKWYEKYKAVIESL
ncbi:SRPBCC family protein [Metabacillus rhizolycopersici]|uniref:SRPBCC family protein n=1 Tax=Metabacillus rhizolycopersici TaxID=2875709 RepID=A0ABS7US48_9BACI|nr:SRPBCC family protein [Metabacillus rhizolycopersici]MBZ5751133.1 SRPBCC family protein [Metabacillus rhizolycopersici]